MINLQMIGIAAACALLLTGGAYIKGRYDGAESCEARHAEAQAKHNEETRRAYDEIKRTAPNDIDKQRAIDWLLKRGRIDPAS